MPFRDQYRAQVALLVRVLPYVATEEAFALKGGTAINLFHREMPRLSVDIDLAFLPVAPRDESLAAISAAMTRIGGAIGDAFPGARVNESRLPEGAVYRLTVRVRGVQIKIEVTPVLRGTVYEPSLMGVSPPVEAMFGFAEIKVVSFADLFGGKLVAAFDRQHPRDLFDIRVLFAREGVDEALRRAFIVYLLSHRRPVAEVLSLRPKDIAVEFARGFSGMTEVDVALGELLETRVVMKDVMVTDMPDNHRKFLVAFEQGTPDWSLLGIEGVDALPAVQWRQRNLDILSPIKRTALVKALEAVLEETRSA